MVIVTRAKKISQRGRKERIILVGFLVGVLGFCFAVGSSVSEKYMIEIVVFFQNCEL